MTDLELKKLIRYLVGRVAPHVKVVLSSKSHPPGEYTFNGKTLVATGNGLKSKLHDVVHLLLASPARRKKIEYGLGSDPYRVSDAELSVSGHLADKEEGYVCGLQYALLVAMGRSDDAKAIVRELDIRELPDAKEIREIRRYRKDALPDEWWDRCIKAVDEMKPPSTEEVIHQLLLKTKSRYSADAVERLLSMISSKGLPIEICTSEHVARTLAEMMQVSCSFVREDHGCPVWLLAR